MGVLLRAGSPDPEVAPPLGYDVAMLAWMASPLDGRYDVGPLDGVPAFLPGCGLLPPGYVALLA